MDSFRLIKLQKLFKVTVGTYISTILLLFLNYGGRK